MNSENIFKKIIVNDDKPITNIWMDFYLDCIKQRLANKHKLSITIINYLTLVCSTIVFIINTVGLAFKLKLEVSLLLFDVSVVLGGIEVFFRMIIILMMIMAMALNYEIRINTHKEMDELLQLLDICRSRVRKLFYFRGRDNRILDKIIKAMIILYKLANILIAIFCE